MQDHIIICGLGAIGFRTYELLKSTQHQIVTVSATAEDEVRWKVEANGDLFLLGDARDDMLLMKAGIKKAKAILILTDNDTVNISIAMDARVLNPTIKIIVRMLDNELGQHMTQALGIHQVFSIPNLAAPVFYGNIYDSIIAAFKIKNTVYFVSEGSINQIKKPTWILKEHIDNHTTAENPIYLSAYPAETHKKKSNFFLDFIDHFHYLRSPVFQDFRRLLFVLLCLIISAALFLSWAMPLNFIDALYFATTTITTVGYGDFNFSESSVLLKLFGCFLMLSGAAAIAVLFSSIIQIILSKKLSSLLGGRPVPKKNHVVVIGTGTVGQKLLSMLLKDKVPVAVVNGSTQDHYGEDINRKVALVDGYLKSKDTLVRAHIQTAKAAIVITNDDVENLSISLVVTKLNPHVKNIVRIFSPRLAKKLEGSLSFGAVLSVPNIVAPYFACAVLEDNVFFAVEWKGQLLYLSDKSPNQLQVVKLINTLP